MCGINGWINWSDSTNLLNEMETMEKMTKTILHRGPEEGGFWKSQDALIGHRRLVVLDAAGGKQPMVYKDGEKSIVLTYNGELYNYLELRKELEELGHKFESKNSDTEVILLSYVQWGEDCPKKFNGMFAFSVFDETKSKLFMARDHVGVKPLFYSARGDSIIFGSEMKVLLANDKLVQPVVDKEGVAQLFYLGAFRTPEIGCVFKQINELGAGKSITFFKNENQGSSSSSFTTKGEVEYWNLRSFKNKEDLKTTENKVKHLIQSSLRGQLASDVPITFLLSGGVASSSLVSLASTLVKNNSLPKSCPLKETTVLKTFSIEFENDENDYKETVNDPNKPWVQKVVDHVQSDHFSATVTTDQMLDNILRPMRARDLPSFGKSEIPLRSMVLKVKQKKGVVLLSDEGADEIFSGYDWFSKEKSLNINRFPWVGEIYANFNLFLKDEILNQVDYKKYGEEIYKKAIKNVPTLDGESESQAKQRIQTWLFIKYFLLYMLEREDRISMYESLEVRVPYCDFNLVEYCFNLPYNIKSIDGIEKGILRRSMINELPKDILKHQKPKGYPLYLPVDTNFFVGMCDILQPIIKDPSSPIMQFIKVDPVQKIISNKTDIKYQTHENQLLIEHLIQVNGWINEYNVKFI